ncbi:MAG: tRNA uridine-5-carboxymethylaminomethyl(34) synthesis GTPase MnmE [Elusimicrobiota bacterium]
MHPSASDPSPSAEDTIAAVATPLGAGGLGVVRLSGPRALEIASSFFRAARPLAEAPSHTLVHGKIFDGPEPVDEAVAGIFRAPRSYTGEEVVEISCHGGVLLVRRVLALCLRAGARAAGPGEFTRRAFLNGKMDLAQAEAVADLIAAQSEGQRRAALSQLEGRLSRLLRDIREPLADLLAQSEAGLDFAEDEVPPLSGDALARRLGAPLERLRALVEAAPCGRLLREGVRAVLVGRPNAGKSSLFNALLGADRAIVAKTPGTTRDTLEERLVVDGVPVALTDTAGLREAADAAEAEGVSRARRACEAADAVICVVDASLPPAAADEEAAALVRAHRGLVVAFSKCDLAPEGPREAARRLFPPEAPWVLTSAITGRGLEELRRRLVPAAASAEAAEGPVLAGLRHEALLAEALSALTEARRAAAAGEGGECLAVSLRRALDALDGVTGQRWDEELLDRIFSRFCIGK